MDVLGKFILLVSLLIVAPLSWSTPDDPDPDPHLIAAREQAKSLCDSTDEYMASLKFLRATKEVILPERTARLVAEKVSESCNGSAERFSRILLLLKSVGLSDRKSLQMGLEFASQPPDVQKNFLEIFSRAFLSEFFDYEYTTAASLAFELSRDYKGDSAQVRDDFLELVRFCKEDKLLALPNRLCAEYTIKLARLSQYYPYGVREPFFKLFKALRERKEFAMDIKTALDVSYNILKSGPRAPDNFFRGYKYATLKEGLDFDRRQALIFAMKMADRSYVGDRPPLVPAPTAARPSGLVLGGARAPLR